MTGEDISKAAWTANNGHTKIISATYLQDLLVVICSLERGFCGARHLDALWRRLLRGARCKLMLIRVQAAS